MISDIKNIRKIELEEEISEYTKSLESAKVKLEEVQKSLSDLRMLAEPRTYSWFEEFIFKRREVREYRQAAIDNQIKLTELEEDRVLFENTIKEYETKLTDANRRNKTVDVANNFEELGFKNIEDVEKLLKDNDKSIVLEKNDRIARFISSKLRKTSELLLIHKTDVIPNSDKILTEAETEESIRTEILIGDSLVSIDIPKFENTVHFTVNGIDYGDPSKYALVFNYDDLDKSRVVSALPNDFFLDSAPNIPKGSKLFVPKSELDSINKSSLKNIEIIAYEDDELTEKNILLSSALSTYMNNYAFHEQDLTSSGWDNKESLMEYQDLIEKDLDKESEIKLEDIVDKKDALPFNLTRFVPHRYTKYLEENSVSRKKVSFAKAIEYLHENIDDYSVQKKELKTKTTVEYDNDILVSNPRDKSTDRVEDVFVDFIELLRERNIEKLDEYINEIDSRYIPDKEEFRDELLKSTSRLKNDAPMRNALFINIFERFIDLEIEKDEVIKEETKPKPKKDNEVKVELEELDNIDDFKVKQVSDDQQEIPEIVIEPRKNTIDDKDDIIKKLQDISEDQEIEDTSKDELEK